MTVVGIGTTQFGSGTLSGVANREDSAKFDQVIQLVRYQAANTTVGITSGNSGSFDRTGLSAVGIVKLLSFGNTSVVGLKYQVSHDNANWRDLKTPAGALITQNIPDQSVTNEAYDVPAEALAFPYIRVVAIGSSQTLVSITVASSLMWVAAA